MSADIEKYKALFEYHKDQFNEEKLRFNRLEDKAYRYLTSLTVAFSAYILLVRSIYQKIEPPYDWLSILVIMSIALTFYASCSAWSFIFRAIKLQTLVKLPSGDKVINTFKNNKKAAIYFGLSRQYADALAIMESEYEEKLRYVRKGYSEVAFTGWSFLASITLIFIYLWR